MDVYLNPGNNGFAGIRNDIYVDKSDQLLYDTIVPALVVELKWNQSAESAIAQIKEKRYPKALKGYGGEVLLVGIGYDRNAKGVRRKHTCKIEKIVIR